MSYDEKIKEYKNEIEIKAFQALKLIREINSLEDKIELLYIEKQKNR